MLKIGYLWIVVQGFDKLKKIKPVYEIELKVPFFIV